jgi:formylglycine-generating enzyme required for sulfatase activity
MTQRHSPSHPKETVVRIFSKDGRFFGTGCLEASGLLVTCAHVVRDALGLPKITADMPPGELGIDFPFLEGLRQTDEAPDRLPFIAKVAPGGWGPSGGVQASNDIAILRLDGLPPFRCGCIFPDYEPNGHDVPVYVHGFRAGGGSDGETVEGRIKAHSKGPDGLWDFDSDRSAYVVNAGFSGAPLYLSHGHAASAEGILIGEPEKGPSKNDPLRDPKRVAFIIPAKRIHAQIEAVYKAETEKRGDDAPEELALARAFVPAARASLENLRNLNSATHFVDGVSRLLERFEIIAGETLDDINLVGLSRIVRQLEGQARRAEESGFAQHLTLFSLPSLCGKLGDFRQRLHKRYPSLADDSTVPNDPLDEERPHRRELDELKAAVEDRLRALKDARLPIAPELCKKARNTLWALDGELDSDPLSLLRIDEMRRELEALDRDVFRELIVASQLLLGRYADRLPPGAVFRDGRDFPEMVVIPAGKFLMGSPPDESGRILYEGPQHEVTIPHRFAVGRYAVTFEDWDAAVAAGGVSYRPDDQGWGRGRQPAVKVSWDDAQVYVKWLTEQTGRSYRLPSEAEWEYCCRAGTMTPFWWGSSITPDKANYNDLFTYGGGSKGEFRRKTLAVDSFEPNPFGLYQVHGNVHEWCEDRWLNSYDGKPGKLGTTGAVWNDDNDNSPILRGGSWATNPRDLRSAYRTGGNSGLRNSDIGFRVARILTY